MRTVTWVLILLLGGLLGACTHVSGVILDDTTNRPMAQARISVGRPGSIGNAETYSPNAQGRFDFYILALDEDQLFVYDGGGPPEATMRRLESWEINDHMRTHLGRAEENPNGGMNIPGMGGMGGGGGMQ